MKSSTIPFLGLNLSKQYVLEEMGYGTVTPDHAVTTILDEFFKLLEKEVVTEYIFDMYEGQMGDGKIIFGNTCLGAGNTITSLLKNSVKYVIFAATAGPHFDKRMQQVKAGDDMLRTYILDAIGTCIVEKTGDIMEMHIKQEINGLNHTNRFSPGYCGWPLTDQRNLFQLIGGRPCGITLSEVCLMHPIKSISGIMGIGQNVNQKLYGCNFCELETCYKRKKLKIRATV